MKNMLFLLVTLAGCGVNGVEVRDVTYLGRVPPALPSAAPVTIVDGPATIAVENIATIRVRCLSSEDCPDAMKAQSRALGGDIVYGVHNAYYPPGVFVVGSDVIATVARAAK